MDPAAALMEPCPPEDRQPAEQPHSPLPEAEAADGTDGAHASSSPPAAPKEEASAAAAAAAIAAVAAGAAPAVVSLADPSSLFPPEPVPSRVIQVTNIAPQATRDQMLTLFTFIGRIEDIRLYPSIRDATIAVTARVCFIKFADFASVGISQHLNNTVFIDRAIIISPISGNEVPDEVSGLVMAQNNSSSAGKSCSSSSAGAPEPRKMPSNMINRLEGVPPAAVIMTHDSRLADAGLPQYPPLPANTPQERVEEIRRTVCVVGLDSTVSAQACMEAFAEAGEVKYFRYCTRQGENTKYALIEFSEHASVVPALQLNDRQLGLSQIKVTHATAAITKPQAKSNEAAQKEIEEAMNKVKEAQNLVAATVDPLMGMLSGGAAVSGATRLSGTRSRSRSRSRRRSRDRYSRRSRSRERRRRSRSRSRDRRRRRSRSKSRERRRKRSRSRSRDRHRRRRSRSKSRERRRRSRSHNRKRDRERRREDKERERKEENGADRLVAENGDGDSRAEKSSEDKRRSRSRDRGSRRSRSRDRKRGGGRRSSRSRSRDRRSKRSRSRSRDRKERKRSRSRDNNRKEKSGRDEEHRSKVSRDYDQEEAGFEDSNSVSSSVRRKESSHHRHAVANKNEDIIQEDDMEISNSP